METSRSLTFLLHALLVILLSPLVHAQFDEVNTLVQAGRYTEASNKLDALAKSAKDVAVKSLCYYQIGEIHYNYTHQYARAAAAYDKIIKLEKKRHCRRRTLSCHY